MSWDHPELAKEIIPHMYQNLPVLNRFVTYRWIKDKQKYMIDQNYFRYDILLYLLDIFKNFLNYNTK